MDYITADEMAEKWGISSRAIKYHLSAGRIPNALKKGKLWLIPSNAEHPADKRRSNKENTDVKSNLTSDLYHVIKLSSVALPSDNPDSIIDIIDEDRIRNIYNAELSYLRGDFSNTLLVYNKTEGDDAFRIRSCPIIISAAISTGDYKTFTKINEYLKKFNNDKTDSLIRYSAEYTLATVAVSVLTPNIVPSWVKNGCFDYLIPETRLNAVYIQAKYYYCISKFEIALTLAKTALTLNSPEKGISLTQIYLQLMCSCCYYALDQKDEAKQLLLIAMNNALPHGFITPFAELITSLGGLIEQCLLENYPSFYAAIIEQWERTWVNWVSFHNQFAKDNITQILNLREYHIAIQVARGISYSKISKQYGISVGRIKNIMLEIREKLFLNSNEDLKKFIL